MPLSTDPIPGIADADPATDSAAVAGRGLGIDAMAARVQDGVQRLAALEVERSHQHRAWREVRATIEREGASTLERLAHEQRQPLPEAELEDSLAGLRAARARWTPAIADAAARRRRRLRARLDGMLAELAHAPRVRTRRSPPSAEVAHEVARRRVEIQAAVDALRGRLDAAGAEAEACARRCHLARREEAASAAPLPPWEPARLLALVGQEIETAAGAMAGFAGSSACSACSAGGAVLVHLLTALPFIAASAVTAWLLPTPQATLWISAVGVVAQVLLVPVIALGRWRLGRRLSALRAAASRAASRLEELEAGACRQPDPQLALDQYLEAMPADDDGRAEALREEAHAELAALRRREQSVIARLDARLAAAVQRIERRRDAARERHGSGLRAELERESASLAARLAAVDGQWAERRCQLESRWRSVLEGIVSAGAEAASQASRRHLPWSASAWSAWAPSTGYADEIPLGTACMAVAELAASIEGNGFPALAPDPALHAGDDLVAMPVALAFPGPSALLVRAGPACRAEALRLANQVALRALTAFQPGRLRLTLIDPVGLGDSFAGLLEIADHDDSLLGGGVLSESARIERGLEDLVAHLEMVIQKHLRGRYATIDEYNREAGELQESLRLVVVADFPAGFSERAQEHLAALIRSGTRCGVHVVVLHDDRKALPAAIDLAWFRHAGLILREVQGRLAIDREGLHSWRFEPEAAPPAGLASRLIAAIGSRSQAAKRIEVPFTAVAPAPEALWSLDASRQLAIPIGKRGADRLQRLELGRGTCQHALIGGRTGSGKSTLFHVLVTSAALWYSPRELEFHLIDFKKGVEFKAFAAHRLPHARVIAIESDREFGLSVLRHLDAELARRGDAFRRAGAQDLAAHRAAGGEHLPRILLLIDEFQEFFTEDDAIARDAALLLDRFVRQGRAFGLHVVLGSQTLGGSYALAKSSLGQMGVRIALPCNETDAHLLLHEDNDAARLLTRPGDAIYNDHAGLAEGNSPFQVCWLPEEQEAAHLRQVAARAEADGWKPSRPPVVFEGDGPSRLEDELELASLVARAPAPTDARMRAPLGQSSSLKGSAEVVLPASAGGNLLLVGQNREAAAATCGAIAIGLAARHAPGHLTLVALDGEDQDGPFARLCARLDSTLPHRVARHEARGVGAVLAELSATLERRQSGAEPSLEPVLLTVFALQRLRQLRPDDDLAGGGAGEPPAERLARILANGPEYGIHAVVWCDSLATVQRGLNRRSLRDFDQRILFQMSAADASELADDDAASRLGLHTALLCAQGEGRREKFRPFSLPGEAYLDALAAGLRTRFGV